GGEHAHGADRAQDLSRRHAQGLDRLRRRPSAQAHLRQRRHRLDLAPHLPALHASHEHVPYRGSSQSMNDLISGQIDMSFEQVVSAGPNILAGDVKALAVTAPRRAAAIPEVSSATEAGLPELQTTAWTALFFPKGTPQPIVERINDKAMRDETVGKRL